MVAEERVVTPLTFGQRGLNGHEVLGSVGYITVRHVVNNPTKRVEHSRVVAHFFEEEPSRPKETLTSGGVNFFGGVDVVFLLQPQHLNRVNLRSVYNKLFGLSLFYAD